MLRGSSSSLTNSGVAWPNSSPYPHRSANSTLTSKGIVQPQRVRGGKVCPSRKEGLGASLRKSRAVLAPPGGERGSKAPKKRNPPHKPRPIALPPLGPQSMTKTTLHLSRNLVRSSSLRTRSASSAEITGSALKGPLTPFALITSGFFPALGDLSASSIERA